MGDRKFPPPLPLHSLTSLPVELQDMIKHYLSRKDFFLCVQVCKSWHDLFIDSLWYSVHTGFWKGYQSLKSIQEFKKTAKGESSFLFTRHIHRIRDLTVGYTSLQELFCEPQQEQRQQQQPTLSLITDVYGHSDDEHMKKNNRLETGFPPFLSLTDLSIDFEEDRPPPPTFRAVNSFPSGGSGASLFGAGTSVGLVSTRIRAELGGTGFGASTATTATTATTVNVHGTAVIREEPPSAPTIPNFGTFASALPLAQPALLTGFGSGTPTIIGCTGAALVAAAAATSAVTAAASVNGVVSGGGGVNFGTPNGVQSTASFLTPTPAPKPKLIDITPLLQILERSKGLKRFTINLAPLLSRGQIKDLNRIMNNLPTSLEALSLRNQTLGFSNPSSTGSNIPDPADITTTMMTTTSSNSNEYRILESLKCLTIEVNQKLVFLNNDQDENSSHLEFELIMKLMDRCPSLEELNAFRFSNDLKLSKILYKNAKNWKTLIGCPGPLSAEIITQHGCSRLENLKIPGETHFSSRHIQQLLCSAKNLKRLDLLPEYGCSDYSVVFMANEIVESEKDWICLDLESFKCMIGGIPRPDLQTRSNGRPLGEFHDSNRYTVQQSRSIQRKVLKQFGRLTKLRELTLGLDNLDDDSGNHQLYWDDEEAEGDYHDMCEIQQNRQYACLTLSLEDGLDLLKDLKKMRRLRVDGMSVLMQEEKERAWIRENWPEYRKDCRDKFWASRGLSMPQGSCAGCGPPERQEIFVDGIDGRDERYEFDWW